MKRIWVLAFFILFFASACALSDAPQPALENEPAATPAIAAAPETNGDLSAAVPAPVEQTNDVVAPQPTREEIRLAQQQLKAAGFDPGSVDGVLGPKTLAALSRFHSGCAALAELLPQATPDKSAGARESLAADQVRLLQARLKDAGFDAGPVDGILRPKTRARWSAIQTGCAALRNFLPEEPKTARRPAQPGAARAKAPAVAIAPAAEPVQPLAGRSLAAAATPSVDEIRLVQLRLREAGFDPGPIDGTLGPKTKIALERYRKARGLKSAPTLASAISDILD